MPREGDDGAEDGALEHGGEEVDRLGADAEAMAVRREEQHPEEERRTEEGQVLELVHELRAECALEQRWRVPDPEREHVDGPCDRRERDEAPGRARRARSAPAQPDAP